MKNRRNILYSKSFRKYINYTPAIAENRYSQSRLASCISTIFFWWKTPNGRVKLKTVVSTSSVFTAGNICDEIASGSKLKCYTLI